MGDLRYQAEESGFYAGIGSGSHWNHSSVNITAGVTPEQRL